MDVCSSIITAYTNTQENKMTLYNIVFANGQKVQQYADNEKAAMEILRGSFWSYGEIKSIKSA